MREGKQGILVHRFTGRKRELDMKLAIGYYLAGLVSGSGGFWAASSGIDLAVLAFLVAVLLIAQGATEH